MVHRADRRLEYARWCIYFASNPQARVWKQTLRDVVDDGRARVLFRVMSQCKVDLVWPNAVTLDSPCRLIRLAKERTTSFEILGEPTGMDDVDEVAAAAPTGVADDARGAPDEVAAAALDEAVVPGTKRRRIVGKMASVCHTSASHVVPLADDAEAASAAGPAIAYHAGAAPADDAQPATQRRCTSGTPLSEAAQFLPFVLLSLKSETICRMFQCDDSFEQGMDKCDVAWDTDLGKGTFKRSMEELR